MKDLPLKRLATVIAGQSPPSVEIDDFYGDGLPFLQGNGEFGSESPTPRNRCDSSRKRCRKGDLLISVRAPVGALNKADREYGIGRGLAAVRPTRALDPAFAWWWLHAAMPHLRAAATGSTYEAVTAEEIGALRVPAWTLDVQQAISYFLSTETRRIDVLILKKRRMLGLLKERKAATLLAAAGGRLTHAGPYALSTLAWLGERPSHWREVLLRLVAATGSGHTPSRNRADWWTDCTIPWITTGEVAQVRSDEQEEIVDTREKVSELGLANSAAVVHPRGTVVLCRTASAGYSGIMAVDMATSQDFATWTCGTQLRPRYLLLCLRAMRPDLLGRLATGSTHKTIYMPDIQSLRIPLPSVEEQDAVVEAAWQRLNSLFAGMQLLQQQITLLQEHRHTLITAAVTGQLEVSGVSA